jgi:thiol-disulfide isomerase/thioredoxin
MARNNGEASSDSRETRSAIVLHQYEKRTIESFKGKPVVANVWASWCPYCVNELPGFGKIQKEFSDQIVILAINRGESAEQARAYLERLGMESDLLYYLDPEDSFYTSIGGFSMPETIFVDREGNVITHKRGPVSADEIRQKVQELLNS